MTLTALALMAQDVGATQWVARFQEGRPTGSPLQLNATLTAYVIMPD
jgi:hypothetical protein